jgi:hypothetical protein
MFRAPEQQQVTCPWLCWSATPDQGAVFVCDGNRTLEKAQTGKRERGRSLKCLVCARRVQTVTNASRSRTIDMLTLFQA